jgi:flagellar biosynthetic protein FlhB
MGGSDAQERTEDATPRRRQQARRKGTVARSIDLNGAVVMVALLIALPAAIGAMANGFLQAMRLGFRDLPTTMDFTTLSGKVGSASSGALAGLAILIGTAMAVGLASNFAQVGFVFSGESLNPSLSKINPLNGLKRLFSRQAAFEGLKALVKTALFGFIAYGAIKGHWAEVTNLSPLPPVAAMGVVGSILKTIGTRLVVLWVVLSGVDYFFQKKQVDKQLKMSKEELRQEMKESETSPELRSAMAQRRRKLMKGRMMDAVKTADVVITNPTHFAVAIRYDTEKDHAPIVVAKGADLIAAKIREVASESRVPIVPNPPLARVLYKKCEIGDAVPRDLFQPVAEVLAYVYRTLKKVRR